MIEFYKEIFKLKTLLRKGWVMRDVCDKGSGRVESDGEHIFSTALIAMIVMKKKNLKLDEAKVLKLALIHELGEIDFGDVTPFDNVSPKEKHLGEKNCVERLAKTYDLPELLELWNEYEEGKTLEAQFVKKMDYLDAVMQSEVYGEQIGGEKGKKLKDDFYFYSLDKIQSFDEFLKQKGKDDNKEGN